MSNENGNGPASLAQPSASDSGASGGSAVQLGGAVVSAREAGPDNSAEIADLAQLVVELIDASKVEDAPDRVRRALAAAYERGMTIGKENTICPDCQRDRNQPTVDGCPHGHPYPAECVDCLFDGGSP